MMTKYHVMFFVSKSGKPVIQNYLNDLDIPVRAKVLRTLQLISRYGLSSLIPQLRKIVSTPLWELRILGRNNIRIICCKQNHNTIVIVHVFVKKTNKTPLRDLRISMERYKRVTNHIDN